MNRQRVINIIREPLQMQHEKDLPLIKELIEEFPYFSTPYVLLTRLLSEQKSIYLDKYLKLSASYIGDREVLYNLIHAAPKQENLPVLDESIVSKNEVAETVAPIVTETAPRPEQSISIETPIYNVERPVETTQVIMPTEELQSPETIEEQELPVAIEKLETHVKEKVTHPEIIHQEAEIEENIHTVYIETEKNASEENLVSENRTTSDETDVLASEIAQDNTIPEEENSTLEPNTEIIEQAVLEPIIVTENLPKEQEIIAEGTETKPAEETQPQQEIKKPEPKKIELDLPPLAAYDYFALHEKRNRKTEKAENPAALTPTEIKAESDLPATNHAETTQTAKLSGNITFGSWLAAMAQNKIAAVPVQANKVEPDKPEIANKHLIKADRKPKREDIEDIISKFIQTEPRIKPKPAKFFTPQDVAERSAEPDHTLVTETLANIYLKQGLTDKAVEIFQQLMLKYPQKSDYFAVKIQEINTKAV